MPTTIPGYEKCLYMDIQSGRTVCYDHLGGYGKADVKANPRGPVWVTPLDVWQKVNAADNAEWRKDFNEDMKCEDCSYSPFGKKYENPNPRAKGR